MGQVAADDTYIFMSCTAYHHHRRRFHRATNPSSLSPSPAPNTLTLASLASSFSLSSPVLRPRLGSSLARAASSRVGGPPGGRKAGRRAGCHWPSSRVANQDAKGARPGHAPSPRSPRRFETDHEERRTRHVRRKREDSLVSPPQLSPREFQTPSGPFPSLLF